MDGKKVGIYLLVLFVLFFIVTDASGAAEYGRQFFSWIGDGLGAALDFIDALFDRDPAQSDVLGVF